jgi:hypothetical protein
MKSAQGDKKKLLKELPHSLKDPSARVDKKTREKLPHSLEDGDVRYRGDGRSAGPIAFLL